MVVTDPTQVLSQFPVWLLIIISIWTLVWKAVALWKSARSARPIWFAVMLVTNTLGILEILYIFVFSKMGFDHLSAKKEKSRKKR